MPPHQLGWHEHGELPSHHLLRLIAKDGHCIGIGEQYVALLINHEDSFGNLCLRRRGGAQSIQFGTDASTLQKEADLAAQIQEEIKQGGILGAGVATKQLDDAEDHVVSESQNAAPNEERKGDG